MTEIPEIGGQLARRPSGAGLGQLIEAKRQTFEGALVNKPVAFDAWKAAVLAEGVRNPEIMEAAIQSPASVIDCLAACANAGLLPGRAFDQFYLIPRNNRKLGCKELTFIIGYKGMCDMAYRHERVHSMEAFVVYEGEEFDFNPSTGTVKHVWNPNVDRSDNKIIAAYSVVRLTTPDGAHVDARPLVWAMTIKEILAVRARSNAFQRGGGPWQTDFAKMVRKTVMRSHFNGGSIPRRSELVSLMSREDDLDSAPVEVTVTDPVRRGSNAMRDALGLDNPTTTPDEHDDHGHPAGGTEGAPASPD